MFDSAYTFNLIDHRQVSSGGPHICTWKYNFRSHRRRYIVEVEMYNGSIYVVKYYANCHAASPNKFNLLLNDEKPAPIIRTCIDIMLRLYQVDPMASFGFIGSHSVNMEFRIFHFLEWKIFPYFGEPEKKTLP